MGGTRSSVMGKIALPHPFSPGAPQFVPHASNATKRRLRTGSQSATQIGEDGQNAAVIVDGGW
jgi:hypothetical protein